MYYVAMLRTLLPGVVVGFHFRIVGSLKNETRSRFLANGIMATLAMRWNVFDTVIIGVSFILQVQATQE